MRTRRWVSAVAALAVLVTVAAASGGGSSDDGDTGTGTGGSGGPSGEVTVGVAMGQTSFDPIDFTTGIGNINYLRPVYDTLTDVSDPTEIKPSVATSWTMDGTSSATITIRDDVRFASGATLDAEGVVANLERMRNRPVDGTGDPVFKGVTAITAVDPTTIEVTFDEPNFDFFDGLGSKQGMMVDPTSLGDASVADEPAGSGPYVLDVGASQAGVSYTYTPTPDYWNADAQLVESLTLRTMEDGAARLNALQAGEVAVTTLDTNLAVQAQDAGLETVITSASFYTMIVLDLAGTTVPALGDVRVRQALAYSIDREAFTSSILNGLAQPSSQPYEEGKLGYSSELDGAFEYDVDKARSLLEDAGYEDGFTFTAPSQPAVQDWAQAITGFYEEIGVRVELSNQDPAVYAGLPGTTEFPVFFFVFPQTDPALLASGFFLPDGILNGFDSNDTELAPLVATANAAVEDSDRQAAMTAVTEHIVENANLIVAARSGSIAAWDPAQASDVSWSGGLGASLNVLLIRAA